MKIKSLGHKCMVIGYITQKDFDERRVAQRAEGKCPHCRREVSIPIPPDSTDWRTHYEDLEKEFEKLQIEYYKEKGYFDKNKEIRRMLLNLDHLRDFDIDNLVKIFKETKNIDIRMR